MQKYEPMFITKMKKFPTRSKSTTALLIHKKCSSLFVIILILSEFQKCRAFRFPLKALNSLEVQTVHSHKSSYRLDIHIPKSSANVPSLRTKINKQFHSLILHQSFSSRITKSEDIRSSNNGSKSINETVNMDEEAISSFSSQASSIPGTASKYDTSNSGREVEKKKKMNAIREADELRRKAKQLKAEAAIAETELQERKRSKQSEQNIEADVVIDALISIIDDMEDYSINNNINDDEQSKTEENKSGSSMKESSLTGSMSTIENESITNFLRIKSLSLPKMVYLIERIHERQLLARGEYNKIRQQMQAQTQKTSFIIGDVKNTSILNDPEKAIQYELLMNTILTSQSTLDLERVQKRNRNMKSLKSTGTPIDTNTTITTSVDINDRNAMTPTLRAQIKELRRADEKVFQNRLALQLATRQQNADDIDPNMNLKSVNVSGFLDSMSSGIIHVDDPKNDSYSKHNDNDRKNVNVTQLMEEIISQPMWVPSSMLGYVMTTRDQISKQDLTLFRKNVVQKSKQFYCTSWDSTSVAAIYRGNIQGDANTLQVWNDLNQLLESCENDATECSSTNNSTISNLKDRLQMFWIYDPEWTKEEGDIKPVIFVTGAKVKPMQAKENGLTTKLFMGISIASSIFTTFAYGLSCYALNPLFYKAFMNDKDMSIFIAALPIFFGVFAIQCLHEVAHYITAKQSNMTIGLPVPLPSFEIGTFGSITPLRSFPSTRTQMFDFALSGPAFTLVVSLMISIAGIVFTIQSPSDVIPNLPVIPVALLKSSFFTGSIISILAPKIMTLPLSQLVPIHPLFLIGFTGLISSSLNLLPIGKLDGGRVVSALFGRRAAFPLSLLTTLFLAIASLTGSSHISILFGLLVLLFQRQPDVQEKDEVTEVEGGEGWRLGIYSFIMVLVGVILAPFPGGSPL